MKSGSMGKCEGMCVKESVRVCVCVCVCARARVSVCIST